MQKILIVFAFGWLVLPSLFGGVVVAQRNVLPLGEKNFDTVIRNNVVLEAAGGFKDADLEKNGSESQVLQGFFSGKNIGGDLSLVQIVNRVLGALGIFYLIIVGIKYIFNNGDDDRMEKAKTEIIWVVVGLIVISVAEFVGFEIFNPAEKDILTDQIVEPLDNKIQQFIRYIEYMVGGLFLMNMILTGYYMLTSAGGEERLEKEKTFIQNFLLGSAFILMAETVGRIYGEDGTNLEKIEIIATEIGGIVNFVLTFLAGASAFMLILASLYYVASFGDEEQAGRAKKTIMASVVSLVIAFSSYVIAQFLII